MEDPKSTPVTGRLRTPDSVRIEFATAFGTGPRRSVPQQLLGDALVALAERWSGREPTIDVLHAQLIDEIVDTARRAEEDGFPLGAIKAMVKKAAKDPRRLVEIMSGTANLHEAADDLRIQPDLLLKQAHIPVNDTGRLT